MEIIISILLLIAVVVIALTFSILYYKLKIKIESLQRRIDNKLTNEESEILEKTLQLNDESKTKISNILSSTENDDFPNNESKKE